MRHSKSRPSVARQGTALAIAIQLAFGPGINALAQAGPVLPQGATVANGQVNISNPNASSLQINASSGAIVNWRSFSIGAGGQVQIGLPSATSAMLNRVTGAESSQLLGSLQSNGRVFLINPNGIVVGAGARIDTNSFVASTLDMSDGDFLAGKLRFLAAPGAGSIRNDGLITAGPGGRIALIAPDVQNTGIIQAPGGQILLAAGRKLEIASLDFEGVTFEIQAPTDSVLNLGKLLAENGAVSAFAGSLRNSGEIRASKMVRDSDGSIRLSGSNEVIITSDSVIRADSTAAGGPGGNITIQSANGTTRVAGVVSATAADGTGGNIQLLGERVAVESATQVDASGSAGGGQILVGGDFQGNNAAVQNARRVYVGEGANLKADATAAGDGGKVIVWADENTRYHGNLSVRGGAAGGNGGNAEVSGKQNLEFAGGADLGAPAGQSGTLLLDPLDILVSTAGGILPSVVDQFSDFAGNVVTISPTKMAAINGNVVLQAERDIYFMDAVALTAAGAGLSATAGGTTFNSVNGGNIFLNQSISTTGGAVNLRGVGISGVGTITTTGGAVDLMTSGSLTYSSAIDSGGGAVNLAGHRANGCFQRHLHHHRGSNAHLSGGQREWGPGHGGYRQFVGDRRVHQRGGQCGEPRQRQFNQFVGRAEQYRRALAGRKRFRQLDRAADFKRWRRAGRGWFDHCANFGCECLQQRNFDRFSRCAPARCAARASAGTRPAARRPGGARVCRPCGQPHAVSPEPHRHRRRAWRYRHQRRQQPAHLEFVKWRIGIERQCHVNRRSYLGIYLERVQRRPEFDQSGFGRRQCGPVERRADVVGNGFKRQPERKRRRPGQPWYGHHHRQQRDCGECPKMQFELFRVHRCEPHHGGHPHGWRNGQRAVDGPGQWRHHRHNPVCGRWVGARECGLAVQQFLGPRPQLQQAVCHHGQHQSGYCHGGQLVPGDQSRRRQHHHCQPGDGRQQCHRTGRRELQPRWHQQHAQCVDAIHHQRGRLDGYFRQR